MEEHDLSTENLRKIQEDIDKNKNGKIEVSEWFNKCRSIYSDIVRDQKNGVNCSYDILENSEF